MNTEIKMTLDLNEIRAIYPAIRHAYKHPYALGYEGEAWQALVEIQEAMREVLREEWL